MDQDLERRIRQRAHELWEAEGRPEGRDIEHWREAERQIMFEEGLGEPTPGGEPDLPRPDRPEPQPEIPADPSPAPDVGTPGQPSELPPSGPQEMPDTGTPAPEMPPSPPAPEVPPPAGGAVVPGPKRSRSHAKPRTTPTG